MSSIRQTERTDAVTPRSTAVVNAIAAHEGVEPAELDRPLYDVVDPDALNELFARPGNDDGLPKGRLVFSYDGLEVQVNSEGDVQVSEVGN